MPGATAAPAASRGKIKTTRVSTLRSRRFTRHSRTRMVLTVSFVLSSGTGLSCPRRFVDHPAKLGASVGAPGPHDFAVRGSTFRLRAQPRPPHPASYVRDDRETPLMWEQDGGRYGCDLGESRREIFFGRGLDRWNRVDPVRQIRRQAQGQRGRMQNRICRQKRFNQKTIPPWSALRASGDLQRRDFPDLLPEFLLRPMQVVPLLQIEPEFGPVSAQLPEP
jgi:hypothetical protein